MKAMVRVVIGTALAAAIAGCGEEHGVTVESEGSPLSVRAETVRIAQVPVTVTAVGTTEPYARATPGTRLLGRVAQVSVDEGDRVAKEQVLVRIEDRDLTARQQQAESALQEARAVLANAEANVQRIRNLYREKALPKQKLDEVETGYARARGRCEGSGGRPAGGGGQSGLHCGGISA